MNPTVALTVAPPSGEGQKLLGVAIRYAKIVARALVGRKVYDVVQRHWPRRSETSRYRDVLAPFCAGHGVDIGFGGDPITPTALRMDLPSPYTAVGKFPVQFAGDCRDLHWFGDDTLDFVYSSHVLEDFPANETMSILREWTRVLRPGGRLILLLPDQQRYLAYCRRTGQISPDGVVGNPHHSIGHFSLAYVDLVARRLGNLKSLAVFEALGPYSFAVVYEKQS